MSNVINSHPWQSFRRPNEFTPLEDNVAPKVSLKMAILPQYRRTQLTKKRSLTGFTLVEQLIVLMLIVAVVGFGSVRFTATFQEHSLDHQIKNLKTVLRLIQLKAIQDQAIYRLSVSEDQKSLLVEKLKAGEEDFKPFRWELLNTAKLPHDFSFEFERGEYYLFYPDGSTSKNRAALIHGDDEHTSVWIANRIGSIEVRNE